MSKNKQKSVPVIICPYCNKQAQFVDNSAFYGRSYGKSYMAYWCKSCDARVGVHENDPCRPLGTMANRELREWRMKAHNLLDPLWKSGKFKRGGIYNELKERLGRVIHIGESDVSQCQEIISTLETIIKERYVTPEEQQIFQ